MDTSEMRELLQGYLSELNWAGGVTKDDIMECLVERDDALLTMVNEYIAEGTYQHLNDVMTLIPVQALQDAQGDTWRGVESQYVEDVDTNFREGPLGQRERDANRLASSSGSGRSTGSNSVAGQGASETPHAGNPGDGAGRIEDPGAQHAGVWPVSGPPSGNPDARIHDMASFGQGERGAAGYEDSGDSEVMTIPPAGGEPGSGDGPGSGTSDDGGNGGGSGHAGEEGSNSGEVDPGVSGRGETVGESPGDTGGAGFGNASGGGGTGDVPSTADRPTRTQTGG